MTKAPNANAVKTTVALKIWSVSMRSTRFPEANNFDVCAAPQVATPETRSAAGAAARCWWRQAAQPRMGRTRKLSCSPVYTAPYVTAVTPTRSAATSRRLPQESGGTSRRCSRLNRNGATTITPMASPVHHTHHADQKCIAGMTPEATRVSAPMEALTSVPRRPPTTMTTVTSSTRSIRVRNPTRRRSVAPSKGPTVLPAAMARAASTEGLMGRLAARAIPEAGHNGVTLCPTKENRRPTRAAR